MTKSGGGIWQISIQHSLCLNLENLSTEGDYKYGLAYVRVGSLVGAGTDK